MSFGFNSEVSVGDVVCHVQTESYDAPRSVIETLAYCRGQIIHRRSTDSSGLAGNSEAENEKLRVRAEVQHRSVIDALRNGRIAIPSVPSNVPTDFSGGIHVRLRNANSWLSKGNASLEVEVIRTDNGHPVGEASVEAHMEGAQDETHFTAVTDADGVARIQFRLPPLKGESAALVIRATVRAGGDEIRYALRSRQKPSPATPAP
ncbi:MAG TPA: hypothetical protein VJN21_07745 [Candidatus Acidoferrales bacterium]|nr:hypothetical protein [Candidatus Acidoferrales bacterium]